MKCLTMGQKDALSPWFYGTMVVPCLYHTGTIPPPRQERVSETVKVGRAVGAVLLNRFRLTMRWETLPCMARFEC